MEIIEKKESGICVFKISGRLDANTSPELKEKIVEAIRKGSRYMIIDFEDLDYISSAGLQVIMKAAKDLKRSEGKIVLSSMQDYVKEIFEIAGFNSFLPIVSTMDDALKKL